MSLLLPLLRRVSVSPAVQVCFGYDCVARDASDRTLDRADEVVWDIHNLQGASSTARQKLSAVAMGSIPSLAVEVVDGPSVGRRSGGRNRVSFDLSKITTHEITPYAEVYGVHPRDFVLTLVDARLCMDISGCDSGDEHTSDSDDDEEFDGRPAWRKIPEQLLGSSAVSRPVVVIMFSACFLVRAFGSEVMREVLVAGHP